MNDLAYAIADALDITVMAAMDYLNEILRKAEDEEDEIIPLALDCLRAPLTLKKGREFCVPVHKPLDAI